jgi:hypothetical protein
MFVFLVERDLKTLASHFRSGRMRKSREAFEIFNAAESPVRMSFEPASRLRLRLERGVLRRAGTVEG